MADHKVRIRKKIQNQAGFTLLEILAVIVILGILAVVATPKYFNLQEEAKKKAMEASAAEAISRVNQHFAKEVLSGTPPDEIVYDADTLSLGTFGDEFSVTIGADTTTTITITISAKEDEVLEGADAVEVPIPRPGNL